MEAPAPRMVSHPPMRADFQDKQLQRWAKSVARKIRLRFWNQPHLMSKDEAEQEALIALWHCTQRMRPGAGAHDLRAYAYQRIRGAIFDRVRENSHYTRPEYRKLMALGEFPSREMAIDEGIMETVPMDCPPPDFEIEGVSEISALKWHLLTDQQLRYVKMRASGMTSRAIAESEGITESRVSQVLTATLMILRGQRPKSQRTPERRAARCGT